MNSNDFVSSMRNALQEVEEDDYQHKCSKMEYFDDIKRRIDSGVIADRFAFIGIVLNSLYIHDQEARHSVFCFIDACDRKYGYSWKFKDLSACEQDAVLRVMF